VTFSNGREHSIDTACIGIIGGGFSGAAMVYHLARYARGPLDLVVYEPRSRVGAGVAYSAPGDHLLLNVPVGELSIDPDRPADFRDWCHSLGRRVDAGAFLPRTWFGAYAEARMAQQIHAAGGSVTLRRVPARLERIDEDSDRLTLADSVGGVVRADHAVLALGHGPTRIPDAIEPYRDSLQVLLSPWNREDMARVAESADRILLVGTGLTMCDAAITLSRMGFRGEMTAISRRGLLPQAHGPSDPTSLRGWAEQLSFDPLRTLRREIRAMARVHGWRSVVDALRGNSSALWGALSLHDQDRFVRRLAPYWDVHRHRLPPECASAIDVLRDAGALRIVRGHLRRVRRTRSRFTCELYSHGFARFETLLADAIVLCTGPDPDPRRWNSPLINKLVADGLASPEVNGLGLRTTNSGLLIGRGAVVQHRLSTLGPLRRGSLWESTAVPEITAQAAQLGRLIASRDARPASAHRSTYHEIAQLSPDHWRNP
jgi:uncharacterized NAD(P)/FAD-binding protein YdhS